MKNNFEKELQWFEDYPPDLEIKATPESELSQYPIYLHKWGWFNRKAHGNKTQSWKVVNIKHRAGHLGYCHTSSPYELETGRENLNTVRSGIDYQIGWNLGKLWGFI